MGFGRRPGKFPFDNTNKIEDAATAGVVVGDSLGSAEGSLADLLEEHAEAAS
ncbi:MAG: hypothetical protein AB8F26_01050 [Phycisphaerales bacterium]